MLNYDALGDFFQGMMDTFMPHKPAATEPPDDPLPETPVLPPLGEDEDRDEEEPDTEPAEADRRELDRANEVARACFELAQKHAALDMELARQTALFFRCRV